MNPSTSPLYYFSYQGGSRSVADTCGLVKFLVFLIGDMKETPLRELENAGLVHHIVKYTQSNNDMYSQYIPKIPLKGMQQGELRFYTNIWETPYKICKLFVSQETKLYRFHHSFFFLLETPQRYTARIEVGCPPAMNTPATLQQSEIDFYFVAYGRMLTRKEVASVLPPTSLSRKMYDIQKKPNIDYLRRFMKVEMYQTSSEQAVKSATAARQIRVLPKT